MGPGVHIKSKAELLRYANKLVIIVILIIKIRVNLSDDLKQNTLKQPRNDNYSINNSTPTEAINQHEISNLPTQITNPTTNLFNEDLTTLASKEFNSGVLTTNQPRIRSTDHLIASSTEQSVTAINLDSEDGLMDSFTNQYNIDYTTPSPRYEDRNAHPQTGSISLISPNDIMLKLYSRGGLHQPTGDQDPISSTLSSLDRSSQNGQTSSYVTNYPAIDSSINALVQDKTYSSTPMSTDIEAHTLPSNADQISKLADPNTQAQTNNEDNPKISSDQISELSKFFDAVKLLDSINQSHKLDQNIQRQPQVGSFPDYGLVTSRLVSPYLDTLGSINPLIHQNYNIKRSLMAGDFGNAQQVDTSPSNKAIQVVIGDTNSSDESNILLKSNKGKVVKSSLALSPSRRSIQRQSDDTNIKLSRDASRRLATRYKALLSRPPYLGNFDAGVAFKNFPINMIAPALDPTSSIKNRVQGLGINEEVVNSAGRKTRDDSRRTLSGSRPSIHFYSANDGMKNEQGSINYAGNKASQSNQMTKVYTASDSDLNVSTEPQNDSSKTNKEADNSSLKTEVKPSSASEQPFKLRDNTKMQTLSIGDTARDPIAVKVRKRDQTERSKSTTPRIVSTTEKPRPTDVSKNQSNLQGNQKSPHQGTIFEKLANLEPTKSLFENEFISRPNYGYLSNPDRLNNNPIRSFFSTKELSFDEIPQPSTIGDYTQNHGVPFRLRLPSTSRPYKTNPYIIPSAGHMFDDSNNVPFYGEYDMNRTNSTGFDIRKKLVMAAIDSVIRNSALPIIDLQNTDSAHNTDFPNQQSDFSNEMIQGIHSDLIGPQTAASNWDFDIPSPTSDIRTTWPSSTNFENPLPVTSIQDQIDSDDINLGIDSEPIAHVPLASEDQGVRLIGPERFYKWALSQMPDLAPIPLSATVPGYLIKLSNGQILAAALTNALSIQGIQKGPLKPAYKKFLHQRLKNLWKANSGQQINPVSVEEEVSPEIQNQLIPSNQNPTPSSSSNSLSFAVTLAKKIFGDRFIKKKRNVYSPPGGFEPPTFWLTAKRASRLRHGGSC